MNIIRNLFRKNKISRCRDLDVVYQVFDALDRNGNFDAMDSIFKEIIFYAEKIETDILLGYCVHGMAFRIHGKFIYFAPFARKCVEIFKTRNLDPRVYRSLENSLAD